MKFHILNIIKTNTKINTKTYVIILTFLFCYLFFLAGNNQTQKPKL